MGGIAEGMEVQFEHGFNERTQKTQALSVAVVTT